MRLRCWLALVCVLGWCAPLPAQVLPHASGAPAALTLPTTVCYNSVATGLASNGVLTCTQVTQAMTTGLVPSGADVDSTGHVTATHLALPLPFAQGGWGPIVGVSGGLPYMNSPASFAVAGPFTLNTPLLGGGPGQPPFSGTLSGTTQQLATVLGPRTTGVALSFDANGNIIASGASTGGGAVASVFGRTGAVVAQPGDYTAAQVTHAADLTASNLFTHPAGQMMTRLLLPGSFSGTVILQAPSVAGSSLMTLPSGTTDFSASGGPGQVVKQLTAGGPFTVASVALTDVVGAANVCTNLTLCSGYQGALGYMPENTANKATASVLGTSDALYPSQNAVKVYVDTGLAGKQNALGFQPEAISNKSTTTTLGLSDTLYPTQRAVKTYVDLLGATLQPILGFTPEDSSNKSTAIALGTSNVLYPTQNAVKSYVDNAVAGKQTALGFTPEDSANKAPSTILGTSNLLYPTQNAVKVYVDTGLATKQPTLSYTPEDAANKASATALGVSNTLYPTQNAVKVYVDTGLAAKQALVTWGAGLSLSGATVSVASTQAGFLTGGGVTPLTCGATGQGRMQVMASGELQYCDGQATAALRSGLLTQSGLQWNVTVTSCTSDTNGGKLTVLATGMIVCASDLGTGGAAVSSVFGRTGAVSAQVGDYSAAQVTNAADLTAANVFTHAAGQSMKQLVLPGTSTGTLALRAPNAAGTSTLTFPAGSTDFSGTGGAGMVVRQTSLGGAFTVSTVAFTDLTGTANVCTTSPLCAGYQAALTFGTGLSLAGSTLSVASTQTGFLNNGGAIQMACGVSAQGRMQVLSTGQLQYCDGATTALLHSGTLTPATLNWNVTIASCTGDTNGGKLTVLGSGDIVCQSDIGGTGTGGGVTSVFGRTGAVVATSGDYSAAQVTNAADLTAANVFTNAAGQSMKQLLLPGSTSGTLTVKAAAVAGVSTLILPGGSTDLSLSGGVGMVVRQNSVGAALTVGTLDFSALTGTANVCLTSSLCTGYQAAVTWGVGLTFAGGTASTLSTKAGFLTNGGATALTCGAGNAGKMQVMTNGDLQYCDGAAPPLLRTGLPTQSGLVWNVTPGACTGDANTGKLTVNLSNQIICAADANTGGVVSVFGRTGTVVAASGDYSAAQVTNAADLSAANTFSNAAGQSMWQLLLPGATSGTLTVKAAAVAGGSILTLPGGTTDFSATGGASMVVRQLTAGGALTVSQLAFADLTGTTGVCTTAGICTGYQGAITWGTGLTLSGGTASVNSVASGFLVNGGATNLTCGAGTAGRLQVMANGEHQYCDGAATPVLRSGFPTQTGLTWNVTAGTCTGDTNGGKLTINLSNQIVCAPDISGTGGGGVASVGTCTSANCFTDAAPSARLTYSFIAKPATPAVGKGTLYVDSTSKNIALEDDAGLIKHGIQTVGVTPGNWIQAIADDGSVTKTAPTKTDVGLGNVDNTSDATKNSAVAIFMNKQINPRVLAMTVTGGTTVKPDVDNADVATALALTANTTVANPTPSVPGNPVDQQSIELIFKSATPVTLTWGTSYSNTCGLALPTTVTGDNVTYNHHLLVYHADNAKWCLMATTKAPLNRVTTLASASAFQCPWANSDQCQMQVANTVTAVTIAQPTGGANDGDLVMFLLQCQANVTLTWDPSFLASPNVSLPSSCPSTTWNTTWMAVGLRYSVSLNKYQILASN